MGTVYLDTSKIEKPNQPNLTRLVFAAEDGYIVTKIYIYCTSIVLWALFKKGTPEP